MEINEKKHKKEQQELIIRKYQQYLKLEKSLSLNTLDAYLTDLDKLMSFLTLEGINVLDVCLSDLQRFAAGLHDIGIHPRSQARILSGIKSFFRFLILENYLEADPSELLEGPKIGFKLPEVLTVEEIDRIISAVDLAAIRPSSRYLHPVPKDLPNSDSGCDRCSPSYHYSNQHTGLRSAKKERSWHSGKHN